MCDDALNADKTGQSSTLKIMFLISLGVFATAALVLSNTQVLLSIDCGPIAATGLVVLHNVVTLIFFRFTSKINLEQTPPSITRLLICIAASSAVSLLSSNFLLEHSSVSFHQIARIFSVPLGAALDFFMEKKKKGILETLLLILICLAAFLATSGEKRASLFNCVLGSIFVSSYVATSAGIRYVARLGDLSSSDVLRKVLPYSIGVSLMSLLVASVSFTLSKPQTSCSVSSIAALAMLSLNCVIAVMVQYLSTWTMKNTSVQIYAILGQVKTAVTVLGGAVLFKQEVMRVTRLAFFLIILFGLLLVFLENTDVARLETKVYMVLSGFVAQQSKWKLIFIIVLVVPFCALLYNIFARQILPLGYLGYLPVSISTDDIVLGSSQDTNLSMTDILHAY